MNGTLRCQGGPEAPPAAVATGGNHAPSQDAVLANELLANIRSGDRAAAARFILASEALIRRRYRQSLNRAARRLVDSQELLSTIARRFDAAVRQGTVRAHSERQLWALVFRIGDHAVIDKRRVLARLERVEGADSDLAYEWRCRLARAARSRPDGAEIELDAMLRSLEDAMDRRVLSLWLTGLDHGAIAEELGMQQPAVRKRWERIRSRLKVTTERSAAR